MSLITSFRNASPCHIFFTNSSKRCNNQRPSIEYQLKFLVRNGELFPSKSLKCVRDCDFDSISSTIVQSQDPSAIAMIPELVADKLTRLVGEFKSLTEPIDRVKRLLHYAMLLAPMDDSARVSRNRVVGCAIQVWLEVKMDENGRMRFKADSDSEITKGFCSCLIWMLDGAEPTEVLAVKIEDLEAVNLGFQVKALNTWQNVLISMLKRTRDLVSEKNGESP